MLRPPTDLQKQRAVERGLREQGYSDGHAGRPARRLVLVYQEAYRRGVQARYREASQA